jgi:hypothetical protein
MKTFIKLQLIAVLLSATLMAGGQPFTPVISSDSTTWDIAWKELFGNVMGRLYTVVSKDSTYYDLYFDFFGSNAEYVGKIREDANIGKIWYTPPDYTDEFLIMDLSLSIGDTFELPVFNTTTPIVVIDVYYIDQRKYIEFDYQTEWNEPLRFIEGIGRNIALHQFWLIGFSYVACKYNSGELVYINSNPNFNQCELDPTGLETVQENLVKVHPNPIGDLLYITFAEPDCRNMDISIFNINGIEVYRNKAQANQVIDLATFQKGLYLIQISYKNSFKNIKIIKQ